MFRKGLLSRRQFERILRPTAEDPVPLIRAHAATFEGTWNVLLVDADPGVRRAALRACGREFHTPPQPSLVPVLLAYLQMGDAETRVLALKALSNHAHGITISRQFLDTIRQAKADPDPRVSKTAKQLFAWVK